MKVMESGSWRDVWKRFRRSTIAIMALAYVIFVALLALFAPLIASSKPLVVRTPSGLAFPAAQDFFTHREGVERVTVGRVLLNPPIRHSPNEIDFTNRLQIFVDPGAIGRRSLGTKPR